MSAMPLPPQQPTSPFQWGKGGVRLTPEEIARRREIAQRMGRSDFSPVGHWTQGLGRVLDGLSAGLENRRISKAEEANRAENDEIMAALLPGAGGAPAGDDVVLRALMSEYASDPVRQVAKMEWGRRQPKAVAPTEIEKLMLARGIVRGSDEWNTNLSTALTNELDPFTTFQGPGMGYTGRQSGLVAALGGGGQTSGVPQTTAPPAEAIDELRRDPSAAGEFDEMFGAGSAARVLGQGGGGERVTGTFLDGL